MFPCGCQVVLCGCVGLHSQCHAAQVPSTPGHTPRESGRGTGGWTGRPELGQSAQRVEAPSGRAHKDAGAVERGEGERRAERGATLPTRHR